MNFIQDCAVLLQNQNKLIDRKEILLQRVKSGYLLKTFLSLPFLDDPNPRGFINNLGKFLTSLYKFIFYNVNLNYS